MTVLIENIHNQPRKYVTNPFNKSNIHIHKYSTPVKVERLVMKMCALLNVLLFLVVLSVLLTDALLSMALYDQLLLLGMDTASAIGITYLFCCSFYILVVGLVFLLDVIMNHGRLMASPPSASPSSSAKSSANSSPPNLDLPPSYRLLMEVEKGELPSYEEATK